MKKAIQNHCTELNSIQEFNPQAVMGKFTRVEMCRACHSSTLHHFLSFGLMPKPNGFLTKQNLNKPERYFPLNVDFCSTCGMVQLEEVISPNELFDHYVYSSSASYPMVEHLRNLAKELVTRFSLSQKDLVLDVGSNDGTLLSVFKQLGITILGIDPAKNIAEIANAQKIPTINDFFSQVSAKKILTSHGTCKVITIVNVLAQIPDWDSLFAGVKTLLHKEGTCLIEFPYLVDTLKTFEFDTMYHEHQSMVSVHPLSIALRRHCLEIFDVKHDPIHGGSIRVFISHIGVRKICKRVDVYLDEENTIGISNPDIYSAYATKVYEIRDEMIQLLNSLIHQKKKIIGYGATAKGNVLLNFCRLNHIQISAIVDSTTFKQGLYTPGSHIPVVSESQLDKLNPDYAILTAWNFADAILKKNKQRIKKGLKFIRPYPIPTVL